MKTDNELIAEFMGYSKEAQESDLWCRDFHENWSALMPVVEKISEPEVEDGKIIRSAADVEILYKACKIHYEPDEDFEDREEHEIQTQGETKIEAVYNAIVKFIKWYNKEVKGLIYLGEV